MQNNAPPNVLNGDMRKEMLRARFLAITSGLVLLLVVSLIVYYRYVVLQDLGGDVGSFKVLAIVMMVLPIAIVIGELFTGDYIWYSIRWLQTLISRNKNRRKFLKFKEQCGYADQLAVQYTENARRQDHPVQVVGDLEHCHMRIKHRSQQQNDYMDPFDKWRRIGFTFRARKNQEPIADATVFGILPNGAKTGDNQTDSDGKVTLYWDGDFDRLIAVKILDRDYVGPFQANAEHYIDLPEDWSLSDSGNGQGTKDTAFVN